MSNGILFFVCANQSRSHNLEDVMETRTLGKSGLKVSALGLDAWA